MYVHVGHVMQHIYLCIYDIVPGTKTGTWDQCNIIIVITRTGTWDFSSCYYFTEGLHLQYFTLLDRRITPLLLHYLTERLFCATNKKNYVLLSSEEIV